MAKRYELKMFGLDVIMRHDYETKGVKEKINEYRARSVKEFTEFLTNVPGSDEFETFLDIGAGDKADMELFKQLNPEYRKVRGVDLYLDEEDYDSELLKMDWYDMQDKGLGRQNAVYINHSMEHAANIYALMEQTSKLQDKGDALFVAVPEGNSEFGYAITSSTTHFSVVTKGYLETTLQRFGYQVVVEEREFRKGAPELWAFAIKQYDGFDND